MEREGVRERIEALRAAWEVMTRARRDEQFPKLAGGRLAVQLEYGTKRVRIVRDEPSSRSVAAFVDLATGDILFPASWSKPAKHARGNVFAEDFGLSAFGDYSVRSLR